MTIGEFTLFHGIVLTKLVRSERPITLRMIETHPNDAWSMYRLNDEVDLFIKHSASPKNIIRGGGGRSWTFVFGADQLRQIKRSGTKGDVYIALVCGDRQVKDKQRCVCLLFPKDVQDTLDLSSISRQTLTVKRQGGKSLRVFVDRLEKLIIPQNRLDNWIVPGN